MATRKNKKIIFASSAIIVSSAVLSTTLFAIEGNKLFNLERSASFKSDFNLSDNSGVQMPETINVNLANTTKSFPNGIITTYGDSCSKIIGISNINPEKKLFNIDLNGYTIRTIEYTPFRDTLVVLVTDEGNNKRPYVYTYEGISTYTDNQTLRQTRFIDVAPAGAMTYNNTWSMIPIINVGGSVTNSYIIYKKMLDESDGGSSKYSKSYATLLDINQGTAKKLDLVFNQKYSNGRPSDIISLNAIYYENNARLYLSYVRSEQDWNVGWKSWAWVDFGCIRFVSKNNNWTSEHNWNNSNNALNVDWDYTKNSWASDSTRALLLNSLSNSGSIAWTGNSWQITSYIPRIRDGYEDNQYFALVRMRMSVDSNDISVNVYWTTRQDYFYTIWYNAFDLSNQIANGLMNSTDSSPFVYVGENPKIPGIDSVGKHIGIVNDAAKISSEISINGSSSSSNLKIYPMAKYKIPDYSISSNRWIYSDFDSSQGSSWLGIQAPYGIPVLEYNTSKQTLNKKVYYMRSGSNNIAIFDRPGNITNYKSSLATYSYRTSPTNLIVNSPNASDAKKLISDVDLNYLISSLKIESQPWSNSTFLKDVIGLYNVNNGAIFTINNLSKDIKKGSATFDLYATRLYMQSNGSIQWTNSLDELKKSFWSNHKIATITVNGFLAISPTALNSPSQAIGDSSILPSNYYNGSSNNKKIQDLISSNKELIFTLVPPTFSSSNILIKQVSTNNPKGTVTVQFTLNNFYNSNYQSVTNSESSRFELEITGFKVQRPTAQIKDSISSQWRDITVNQFLAQSDWTNELKNFISSKVNEIFENIPSDFSSNNINIISTTKENSQGVLTVSFSINNYYNGEGILTNTVSETFSLSITDFKAQPPTVLPSNGTIFNIGFGSITVNNFVQNMNAADLIFPNKAIVFQNLPSDFELSNINIVSQRPNNKEGILEVSLNITKWFDSHGEIQTSASETRTIKITGFKIQSGTTYIGGQTLNYGSSQQLASQWLTSSVVVANKLFENIDSLFEELPQEMNVSNIIIKQASVDNTKGQISVMFSLNKYHDEDGQVVQDDNFENISVVITGFKIQKATIFPISGSEYAIGKNDVSPTDFYSNDNNNIQDLIHKNKETLFENLPLDFSPENINVTSVETNNLDGTIIITFNINNWFNEKGLLEMSNSKTFVITATGFKIQKPTSLKKNTLDANESQIIPSDFYTGVQDNDKISNLIIKNKDLLFENIPSDIEAQNVIIKDVSTNNVDGTISVTFNLDKFFNENGILTTDSESSEFAILFTDFKFQKPTTVKANSLPIGIRNQRASDYYNGLNFENKLRQLIFNNANSIFDNLPINFDIEDIIFTNTNFNVNNAEGKLSFVFWINNYFDDQGLLVSDANKPFEINFEITKFRTDISTTQISASSININDVSQILPSAWNSWQNQIKQRIIDSKKIENLFNENITVDDIVLTNVKYDDFVGKIQFDLILNNHVAQQKGIAQESFTLEGVVLNGFKIYTDGFTSIFNGGSLNGFSNTLPNQVTNQQLNTDEVKQQFVEMIHYPVSGEEIAIDDLSIELVADSADITNGSIRVNVTVNNSKVWIKGQIQSTYTFKNEVLSGFKTQKPTELKNNIINAYNNTQKPSDYQNIINHNLLVRNFIVQRRVEIFTDLPSNFNINNVEIIEVVPNNSEGKLFVTMSITNYFDNRGQITNQPREFTITIEGLKVTNAKSNTLKTSTIVGGVASILGGIILVAVVIYLIKKKKQAN